MEQLSHGGPSSSLYITVHTGLTRVNETSLAVLGAVRLSMASRALDEGDAKRRASRRLTRTASLHQPIVLIEQLFTRCVLGSLS